MTHYTVADFLKPRSFGDFTFEYYPAEHVLRVTHVGGIAIELNDQDLRQYGSFGQLLAAAIEKFKVAWSTHVEEMRAKAAAYKREEACE